MEQSLKSWSNLGQDCVTLHLKNVPMDKEISLRAAARLESICGGQGIFKSNCTGNCITNGCKCHKAGLKCNSRCHNKRSCTNKE